jgi:hypothetical protein
MGKNRSTPPAADQVKARVLTSCSFGEANDVVTLPAADAAAGMAEGILDTTPEAVAYAESIDGASEA